METALPGKTIIGFTLPLTILISAISLAGIFVPGIYSEETANWTAQAVGQDIIDLLFIMPALIITAFLTYKKNKIGLLLLPGVLIYLVYTFLIYCFSVHFNRLFLLYCFTLGLSFYFLLYVFLHLIKEPVAKPVNKKIPYKSTGILFIAVSAMFYLLWLSDIVPAVIANNVPAVLNDTGLIVNPVHVIDLSIILPGAFITGILLLKKKHLGILAAPSFLFFFILMTVTIGWLAFYMLKKGVTEEAGIIYLFLFFLIIYCIALFKFIKALKPSK